jgi:hypothetical protein
MSVPKPTYVPINLMGHTICAVVSAALKAATPEEDAEAMLHKVGVKTGERLLDILYVREKPFKRETKFISFLQFIAGPAWRQLFNRSAEVSMSDNGEEYYIVDRGLLLNKFLSPPPDAEDFLNCGGAIAAGMVEGMLQRAGYNKSVFAVFSNENPVDDWMGTTLVIRDVPVQNEEDKPKWEPKSWTDWIIDPPPYVFDDTDVFKFKRSEPANPPNL